MPSSPSPHRGSDRHQRGHHVTTHRVRVPHDVADFLREYPAEERRAVRNELVRIGMLRLAQEGVAATADADHNDERRSGSSSRRRARASSAGVARVAHDQQQHHHQKQPQMRPEHGRTEWKRIITHERRASEASEAPAAYGARTAVTPPRRDSSRSRVTAMLTESPPVTPPRAHGPQASPQRSERPKPAAWFCSFDDSGVDDSGDIPPALPREEIQPHRRRRQQHDVQQQQQQQGPAVPSRQVAGGRDPSYSVVVHTSTTSSRRRHGKHAAVAAATGRSSPESAGAPDGADDSDEDEQDRFYDAARDDARPDESHKHGSRHRNRRRRTRSANGRSDEAAWGGSSQEALRTSPPATLDAFLRRQRRREQRAKAASPDVEIRVPKGAMMTKEGRSSDEPHAAGSGGPEGILGAARFLTVHSTRAPQSPGCDTMHSVSVSSASAVPTGAGPRRRSFGDTSGGLSQQPSAETYLAAARLPDPQLGQEPSAQAQRQSSSSGVDAFNVLSPNVTPGATPSAAQEGNATDFPAFAHLQGADAGGGVTTTGSDQTVQSQQSQGPPNYSFAAPQGVNSQPQHHHHLPGDFVRNGSSIMTDGPTSVGVPPYMEPSNGGAVDTDAATMQAMMRLPAPLSDVPRAGSSEGTAVPQKEHSPGASDRGMTMPDFGAAMDAGADSDGGQPVPKGSHSTYAPGSLTTDTSPNVLRQTTAEAHDDDEGGDNGASAQDASPLVLGRPRGLSGSSAASLRGTALDDSGSTVRLHHNANRAITPPTLSVRFPALASVFSSSGVGSVVTPPSGGDPYTPGGSATSLGAASFGFISVNTMASSSGMLGTPASGGGLSTSPPGFATGAQRTVQRDLRRIVAESGGRRMSRVQVAVALRMDPSGRVAMSEGFAKMYRDTLLEFHSTKLPW